MDESAPKDRSGARSDDGKPVVSLTESPAAMPSAAASDAPDHWAILKEDAEVRELVRKYLDRERR